MTMEMTTLGDLVSLQRGYDLTENQRRPGTVPIVGSAGVHGYHDTARAQGPGVALGRSGASFGKVTFVRQDYWPHNTTLFVTDFKGNDPAFIRYLLESLDFSSLNSGSAQQSLNRNFIYPVRAPKFSLPRQQRIAGILSAYDDLIENCQQRIKILESMARALYREWFVHFRFPGHKSHPYVASQLGEIPEGWEVKQLGEIAEDMRRNVPKGKLSEPRPFVGLEHIPRRSLALGAWEDATDLGSNKLAFKKGEVLFGKIRPYFHKVTVAPFDGLCSADTIVIRARRQEHFAIVVACVSSDAFVAEASAAANGAKMPRASWDVLKRYRLVVPTGEAAAKFSTSFASMIAQQQALISQIQNLRRTRDLLLPRLLSGQVELKAA
jgi:type I restriction enzyme S subunit